MFSKKDTGEKKGMWKKQLLKEVQNCLKDFRIQNIIFLFFASFLVNFIIETLALFKYDGFLGAIEKLLPSFNNVFKGGPEAFAGFMGLFTNPIKVFHDPLVFLYNTLLIMAFLSLGLMFKRRYFVMTLLSSVLLGFGIANFVILSYRVTPFSAVELKLIDAALGVLDSYASLPVVIVVLLLVVLVLGVIVFVWLKAPKIEEFNHFSSAICVAGVFLTVVVATFLGLKTGILASQLPNLSVNYQEYGFVYCLSSSFKTGIGKPNDYSSEKVKEIQNETNNKLTGVSGESVEYVPSATLNVTDDSQLPNVIFLQLESFFDITKMEELVLSEDPIPTFHKCEAEHSSGFLSVPSVGAGTANTEFEINTGLNLDFFGPGEYPYKTVLKDETCETIAYNLKQHRFTTQAIHNNRATFYSRNTVFSRLGFDIFTTMELMWVDEYTPNGWVKDKVLTGEIIKSLKGTEGRDYLFTISVQGHGDYPTTPIEESPVEVVSGVSVESDKNRIQYYVNQIHEMDQFLQELIHELEQLGEPTILVAYGDHLPNLDIDEDELTNKNLFQTSYFVWDNMGLGAVDEDIEAYQLSAKILKTLGVKDGTINAFHQANWKNRGNADYLSKLKMLGYDMLYGDKNATDGEVVYEPTNISYGIDNVSVSSAYRDQSDTSYMIIKGNGFTNYSVVYVNGQKVSSEVIDPNTLRIRLDKQQADAIIHVEQSYKGKLVLQKSNQIIYSYVNEMNVYEDGDDNVDEEAGTHGEDWAGLIEEQDAIDDGQTLGGN